MLVYAIAVLAQIHFLLKQGDGYTMFAGQPVKVAPEAGNLISSALETYVAAKQNIAPAVDGRRAALRDLPDGGAEADSARACQAAADPAR
jgi:hypothetical protein